MMTAKEEAERVMKPVEPGVVADRRENRSLGPMQSSGPTWILGVDRAISIMRIYVYMCISIIMLCYLL